VTAFDMAMVSFKFYPNYPLMGFYSSRR